MTIKFFRNQLFSILNEDISFISNIELIESENCFLIRCADHSKFSLVIQDINTYYLNIATHDKRQQQALIQDYLKTHTKEDYLSDLLILQQENPYLFQILFVLLKLLELNIMSRSMAEDIMLKVAPYEQYLKDEWHNINDKS